MVEAASLGLAVEDYLVFCKASKEYNTVKGINTALNHLLAAFTGSRQIASISDDELQAWFTKHDAAFAPSTLQVFRANMKTFFAYHGRPIRKQIVLRKEHKTDVDALADDEIAALLEACEMDIERRLVCYGLATGCRPAELWALEASDFKQDMQAVRIQRQMAWPGLQTKGLKGKRNRTTLVLPGFIVTEPPPGRILPLLTKDKAGYLFMELLNRAGCYRPRRGAHVLRHTYGRLGMERYKWRLELLQKFLGHTNIKTTTVYAHFGEEQAIKEAKLLTYQQP